MDRTTIERAGQLIKMGYNYHDSDKLRQSSYKGNIKLVTDAMKEIYSNVLCIRAYKLSKAMVELHDDTVIEKSMTASEIRSYMYETSLLILSDAKSLECTIDDDELNDAINFTIFEQTGEDYE